MLHKLSVWLLKKIVLRGEAKQNLAFNYAMTEQELDRIGKFRLAQYQRRLPYMLSSLDPDGQDAFDQHSYHFYIQDEQHILAVVRYTPAPFELAQLLQKDQFFAVLTENNQEKTLEISRLIAADTHHYRGLMPALLLYSSLYLSLVGGYRYYITYCRADRAAKFSSFRQNVTQQQFKIPSRGEQHYLLYAGTLSSACWQGIRSAYQRRVKKNHA